MLRANVAEGVHTVDELRGIGGEVSGPDQVMKKLG